MQRVTITKRMKPYVLRKNSNISCAESRKREESETARNESEVFAAKFHPISIHFPSTSTRSCNYFMYILQSIRKKPLKKHVRLEYYEKIIFHIKFVKNK